MLRIHPISQRGQVVRLPHRFPRLHLGLFTFPRILNPLARLFSPGQAEQVQPAVALYIHQFHHTQYQSLHILQTRDFHNLQFLQIIILIPPILLGPEPLILRRHLVQLQTLPINLAVVTTTLQPL